MFTYTATIQSVVGGSSIDVQVQANDVFQARKMVEQIYGPVKVWYFGPTRQ